MTKEPRSEFYDVSLSEAIADVPGSLNDLPVGMWQMVDFGRKAFGLEGPELADYLRRCIHALMDAGAKPVVQREGSSKWYLQQTSRTYISG